MSPAVLDDAAAAPAKGRQLLLVTPELKGADVLSVQRELLTLGIDPGPLDGVYGPATAAAVRTFQRTRALRVDGIVGTETSHALASKLSPKHPPAKPPGELALFWMRERIGLAEDPPGSNDNAITREFGLPGQPWCCMTVSLAFKHGAGLVLGASTSPPSWGYWPGRGFAYVPALEAWLKTAGYWIGVTKPEPGDIACYLVPRETVQPAHVGLVSSVDAPGRFTAIEGNYANEISRVQRTVGEVTGFGRVRR